MELPFCYATCGTAWAACYTTAGLIAGTVVASSLAPAAAIACNAAEGTCMTACTGVSIAAWSWNPVALGAIATMSTAMAIKRLRRHGGPLTSKL